MEQFLLVELYGSRFGEDPVDGFTFHGVSVSFAKDSSVGFGALKKALKSLSVMRSAIALSLEELTRALLSNTSSKQRLRIRCRKVSRASKASADSAHQ